MKNQRALIAAEFLEQLGYSVPADILSEMLLATKDEPLVVYEIGDFVQFYQGMGESWFGTVIECPDSGPMRNTYRISQWTPDSNYSLPQCSVTHTDMRGIATEEQAIEYNRIRSGL